MIIIWTSCIILVLGVRLWWVWREIWSTRHHGCIPRPTQARIRTLVVLGSGGHTSEMIDLLHKIDSSRYELVYVKAITDTTSKWKLPSDRERVLDIPRSRHVGQSYFTSIATTIYAVCVCFVLVLRLQPHLILCNGPGTSLPPCLAALFWRILGVLDTKIYFCESFCRVHSLSLTGRLLYPVADGMAVHWPELHRLYPSTTLLTSLVPPKTTK